MLRRDGCEALLDPSNSKMCTLHSRALPCEFAAMFGSWADVYLRCVAVLVEKRWGLAVARSEPTVVKHALGLVVAALIVGAAC